VTSPRPVAEVQRTGQRSQTATEDAALAPRGKTSFLDRQRAARPWVDHLVRAGLRYNQQKGDYYAAGMTYFSVLALVPLLMVAFAVAGFVLAGNAALLTQVRDQVSAGVPGELRALVGTLIDTAITSRTSVGVIGLLGALYSGLGWVANLREALTAQWDQQHERGGFLQTKLADLGALVGLLLALIVSFALSAVGGGSTRFVLRLVRLDAVPGAFLVTRTLAIALSIAATWAVFMWVIARLPREPVTVRSAARAALLASVVFELFKQLAAVYLNTVTSGTAGQVFGPVLGILVFVFFTSRFLLFATAWAATAADNAADIAVAVPGPAVVTTQVQISAAPNLRAVLAGFGVGAIAMLGLRHRRGRR